MREVRDRYEIFLKVCETGNFTKAAEALNYTQSGISQMMAGLEEELGVQLFARAKKGVVLTDNGQRLIPYIREMVNQKEKLRQAAFNINNKVEGKLRIGSFSSVTAMWLPHVVHFFKENYPQVEVQIFDGNYDEIHDWIIRGQVDCGFLSSILAEDLTFYPLHQDALCAVLPREHPLAQRSSVTPEELLQYPFIIETPGCDNDILHLLEKYPHKPQTVYSFRDDTLIGCLRQARPRRHDLAGACHAGVRKQCGDPPARAGELPHHRSRVRAHRKLGHGADAARIFAGKSVRRVSGYPLPRMASISCSGAVVGCRS